MTEPLIRLGSTEVRVENVTVRYGRDTALRGVSHVFESHQAHAIVGPSGCGKSTLLRSIVGLIAPSSGQVFLGDQSMNRATANQLRTNIGYVIQEGGLFPHLTAWQNATLMARHLGWNSENVNGRLAELAELTQLTSAQLQRYPTELSGGQRQRVSIIRALMLDPVILLLDEPLGALDPMIRSSLQKDLREIFRRLDKTVILVTHDLPEAAMLADQIILMSDGQIVQSGSYDELEESPSEPFVTEFIRAQSPINLANQDS